MRNSVTLKVKEIRRIPEYGIPRNSAEFRAIPYTIRNIRNKKKTYGIPYKRNSENTLAD
jgi:hypothetical protein